MRGPGAHVMKAVIQEEVSGCGIACVAALTGKSYEETRRVANGLGIFAEDPRLWSETTHVRTLLAHFRILAAAGETPFESWDALPPMALLSTKWHLERGHPFGTGWFSGAEQRGLWCWIHGKAWRRISVGTLAESSQGGTSK